MAIGQDRYRRRYWVLPQCGGVFVEGIGSGEGTSLASLKHRMEFCCLVFTFNLLHSGHEEMEKERKRQWTPQSLRVKEEEPEETKAAAVNTDCRFTSPESQQDKDSLNLFLQKPGSFSKLSKLLEVAKAAQDSDITSSSSRSAKVPAAASYPSYPTSQISSAPLGSMDKADISAPQLKGGSWPTCGAPSVRQDEPRVSKAAMEKSSQWFSLFPRSPCDEASVTSGSSPTAVPPSSSSPLQSGSTRSPPSASPPNPTALAAPGINTTQPSVLQVGG